MEEGGGLCPESLGLARLEELCSLSVENGFPVQS